MSGTQQPWRLNWASFGIGAKRPEAAGTEGLTEFSIFVGDLPNEIGDAGLLETFRQHYPSACNPILPAQVRA